jgi:hypothetical protein
MMTYGHLNREKLDRLLATLEADERDLPALDRIQTATARYNARRKRRRIERVRAELEARAAWFVAELAKIEAAGIAVWHGSLSAPLRRAPYRRRSVPVREVHR